MERAARRNRMSRVGRFRHVEGTATMEKPAGNTGHARHHCQRRRVNIAISTLDSPFLARPCDSARLVWTPILLDVEGYEDRALKGTAKTLDRFRPLVVVELWPPAMQQQGTSVEAVADELAKHDYRLFAPHRRQLLPLAELPRGDTGVYAFCFHKDRVPNVLSAEKGEREREKGGREKTTGRHLPFAPSPLLPFSSTGLNRHSMLQGQPFPGGDH